MMSLDGLMSLSMTIDSNILLTCYNYVQNSNLMIDVVFAVLGSQNGIRDSTIRYFSRYNVIRSIFDHHNISKGC